MGCRVSMGQIEFVGLRQAGDGFYGAWTGRGWTLTGPDCAPAGHRATGLRLSITDLTPLARLGENRKDFLNPWIQLYNPVKPDLPSPRRRERGAKSAFFSGCIPSSLSLMATAADAQAVKSLNKSPGRRRFVFKTFCQRIEEIDIDVFRSLDPLKSEPSEGSSFFRDCLVEWRELNTAEDFITFYEQMMPFVQTLPQIILHKELILSELLSRLQMKGRLSLEPILRLLAALSRDLLEDFLPFLQRVAGSLVSLLKSGADREPEIIEQIFTSWSSIMMYLQKYLVRDVVHILSYLIHPIP
ncbi:unnamed protein product [Thlaspi arvense]|uniref:Uncharacterized protein n=1 Tax=Thlaspi arvense TaxID=13288 RepID=A0AAU9RGU8_THLAR|nr:unnamed protein product [Thlaspi arvense]